MGNLKKLERLQITSAAEVDLSQLARLEKLKEIVVTSSPVVLPRSFSEFKNLKLLSLYGTNVSSVESLRFCKNLQTLILRHSVLAEKSVRLLLTSEEALMRFLEGMPADIRVTVRALIDDMRQQGSGSQFPIPTSPKTQPRSDKRRNRNRE